MKTDIPKNSTVITTPGGNISMQNSNAGAQFNITHPSGSNIQLTDVGTSSFNSGNYQELTIDDKFSTTYGDNSSFIGKTQETRIEGDLIEFVGPSSLLIEESMDEWYKAYGTGYGSFKLQWPDNRMNLSPSDYPVNTVFDAPANMVANFVFCPELINGTYADVAKNKPDGYLSLDQRMGLDTENPDPAVVEAKNAALKNLTDIYADLTINAANAYKLGIKF